VALHRQTNVLQYGQIGKQIGQLKRTPDATLGALRRAEPGDVFPVQAHRARGGWQLPRNQVEVRGFSGTVGPDDRGQRAGTELAAHVIDGDMTAKTDAEAVRRQNGMFFVHEMRDR
jgi:hypothetical protein